MLHDRIFIPFLALLVAGIIYVAFVYGPQPDSSANPLTADPLLGFLIEGDDLRLLRNGPGFSLEFMETEEDGKFARTAAGQMPGQGIPSAGVFLTLLPDIGEAWEGHTIFVSFEMRQPPKSGSKDVSIQYFSVGAGNDPPVLCDASPVWQNCSLVHLAPVSDAPPNIQYVGIWPDTKGLSRFIDIRKINITLGKIQPPEVGAE